MTKRHIKSFHRQSIYLQKCSIYRIWFYILKNNANLNYYFTNFATSKLTGYFLGICHHGFYGGAELPLML